jgi:Tfp pilus assembly protein PilF
MKDAQEAFEAAIQINPQHSPQEAYLHLGKLYMQQGLVEYAADVYSHACSSYPCCSSWLGLGLAYLRMGKLADADLVFAEAVTCDPQNPIPRSYLALIHILVDNKVEACECLEIAEQDGLADAGILQEIGEAFASKGMFHEAAASLRRAVACSPQPSFSCLASLGEVHLSCNAIRAARAAWANARVLATGEELKLADAALTNIKMLLGEQDDCPTEVEPKAVCVDSM